jgi:hypothetical protein
VKAGVAAAAAVVMAMVAFRRVRGVARPEIRRAQTRQAIGTRSRRFLTAVLVVARVAVGVAALAGIVWLTLHLFT